MTAEEIIEDMYRIYPNLPSPVHEPLKFRYYIKMYMFQKGLLK